MGNSNDTKMVDKASVSKGEVEESDTDGSSTELGFVISTEGTEEISAGDSEKPEAEVDGSAEVPPKKKRRKGGRKERPGIYKYDRTVER